MNRFNQTLATHGLSLTRGATRVLQLNIGKKCNQTCAHCHVNAGPARTELMTRQTIERVLDWIDRYPVETVDITGGAPELNPYFRFLVSELRFKGCHVMDRCNLTVLFEPGQEELARFLARNEVEIVASLPCYGIENVDAQRGNGVFDKSIAALQMLNRLGYAHDSRLKLHLVYNPSGAFLPPPQAALEADYKRELRQHFGIEFNSLFALANLPVSRFATQLRRDNELEAYMELLASAFNPVTVDGLMCRTTINVGWQGEVYDCDFNGMLNLQWQDEKPLYLWDLKGREIEGRFIATGKHCFGCTAGAGSSCGGALAS